MKAVPDTLLYVLPQCTSVLRLACCNLGVLYLGSIFLLLSSFMFLYVHLEYLRQTTENVKTKCC